MIITDIVRVNYKFDSSTNLQIFSYASYRKPVDNNVDNEFLDSLTYDNH